MTAEAAAEETEEVLMGMLRMPHRQADDLNHIM